MDSAVVRTLDQRQALLLLNEELRRAESNFVRDYYRTNPDKANKQCLDLAGLLNNAYQGKDLSLLDADQKHLRVQLLNSKCGQYLLKTIKQCKGRKAEAQQRKVLQSLEAKQIAQQANIASTVLAAGARGAQKKIVKTSRLSKKQKLESGVQKPKTEQQIRLHLRVKSSENSRPCIELREQRVKDSTLAITRLTFNCSDDNNDSLHQPEDKCVSDELMSDKKLKSLLLHSREDSVALLRRVLLREMYQAREREQVKERGRVVPHQQESARPKTAKLQWRSSSFFDQTERVKLSSRRYERDGLFQRVRFTEIADGLENQSRKTKVGRSVSYSQVGVRPKREGPREGAHCQVLYHEQERKGKPVSGKKDNYFSTREMKAIDQLCQLQANKRFQFYLNRRRYVKLFERKAKSRSIEKSDRK